MTRPLDDEGPPTVSYFCACCGFEGPANIQTHPGIPATHESPAEDGWFEIHCPECGERSDSMDLDECESCGVFSSMLEDNLLCTDCAEEETI